MELSMEKLCPYCVEQECSIVNNCKNSEDCILNLIIYEDMDVVLFYNLSEKRIFKIECNKGMKELDFREAIREIDIIPKKEPAWKRMKILKLAKDLGFFGIN